MIRTQDPNTSCNCGKVTKDRSTLKNRSKIYDTRSSGPRRNGDRPFEEKVGVRNNSVKSKDKFYTSNMEKNTANVASVNNKSFNLRNSTINSSKASTNKLDDNNMVFANGNARHSCTDAEDDNGGVKEDSEIVESANVRSNKICDDSNKLLCNKTIPQVVEVESERELREGKQNGDCERRVCGEQSDIHSNHKKNEYEGKESCTKRGEKSVEKIGNENRANGHLNGCKREQNTNGKVDFLVKDVVIIDDNGDSNLCPERKKRKSKFEAIFDSYAELACDSDKRRSRRPPESYSPEPARRIKLEHFFDEKLNGFKIPSPKIYNKYKKIKPIRKYKHRGPIFHYLDLYIKNKDILGKQKQETKCVEQQEEVGKESPSLDTSLKNVECDSACPPSSRINDSVDSFLLDECSRDSVHTDCFEMESSDSPHLTLHNEKILPPVLLTDTVGGNLVGEDNRLKRKAKVKPMALDAEIQAILGYRCDKGRHEFLVLFHNGTSNWVIQDHNISISQTYQDFFQHSEHELSAINRLAYYISEYANDIEIDINIENTIEDQNISIEANQKVSGSPQHLQDDKCKPVSMEIEHGQSKSILNGESAVHTEETEKISVSIDTQFTGSLLEISPICTEYKDKALNVNLNELCYYVMSSRHIKLYPYETTKEVVFKRDDEFMHIYLKNTRKNLDNNIQQGEQKINIRSCEKLIYELEDCAVDDTCEVVVISGIEEYFALKELFDKLIKKTSNVEGKDYEQDISMLRYLIQTIRNFTKPICAVIKKTASGLPASMLSLFDMVFDERGENFKNYPKKEKKNKKKKYVPSKTSKEKNGECGPDNFQSYLFPRLMGLTESNESRIMGEVKRLYNPSDNVSLSTKRTFSAQLRKSLRNMRTNTKIPSKMSSRKHSRSEGEVHEIEETFTPIVDEVFQCSVPEKTSSFENLEMEIQRERELTQKTMADLHALLLSMEPP